MFKSFVLFIARSIGDMPLLGSLFSVIRSVILSSTWETGDEQYVEAQDIICCLT